MPEVVYGSAGIVRAVNNAVNNAAYQSKAGAFGGKLLAARVKHIILDDTDPNFQAFGEWNSIGIIFWDPVDQPSPEGQYSKTNYASSFFPNVKNYPLLNELVYILQLPTSNISTDVTSNGYYYLPPINVWNSQHHNAMPASQGVPDQVEDYDSAFQGEVRRPEDNSTEINLGKTFIERLGVRPLLPYEGDIIYEGRWGNSIRLGSTVKNTTLTNGWSTTGENGDPITIIRNGQAKYDGDPWVPQVEDINKDQSDIWLTSTQKLNINGIVGGFSSFAKSTPVIDPREYDKNQIALISGRVFLGAKTDSIILRANKAIHLASNTSINMDGSKEIVLNASKVYLGSSEGTPGVQLQSVILGEELVETLKFINSSLKVVAAGLEKASDLKSLAAISNVGTTLRQSCLDLEKTLNDKTFLSKTVLTTK